MFDTETSSLRLQVVGVCRSAAVQISALVERWVRCNGAEETVARLKEMKVNLLRHHAGLEHIPSAKRWIRYRGGAPKGAFGLLFRLPKSRFRTAWNAMMVYTQLVYYDQEVLVTEEQWTNLLASVTREPVQVVPLIEGLALVHKSPLEVRISVPETTGDSLLDYQTRDTKRAPNATGDKTAPEPSMLIDSLNVLWERTVWSVENWDILSGTLAGVDMFVTNMLELNLADELRSGPPLAERPLMGSISLIQEAGYKLRFAANPHRVYQAALQPLGRALFRGLRQVYQDCTYDHEKGVRLVQEWLQRGLPAVSMDLSSATDLAPLDLQLENLSRCGVPTRWLQFLRSTCTGDWVVNPTRSGSRRTVLHWTVGAPLGLYPTFACFALWYHSVVRAAFAECGWDCSQQDLPYVILGDDLVICDYKVASVVRGWFTKWGMKVADHKSLSSDSVAEFAGRVITASDVVRGFKWKGRATDESFVDFARNFGPGSLLMMRPRHKRVLAYIADLPEPFGLGWNPYGIPLEERLTPLIQRVWERDERKRTFSSRAQRANRALYLSERARIASRYRVWADVDAATSDQEAEMVVEAMLPGLASLGAAIWPNLPTVGLERGVPEEVKTMLEEMMRHYSLVEDRDTLTTLAILERKIRAVLSRSR